MDKHKIDYEDALHLTAAIKAGATEIVSNDKDFDGTAIKRVF
jgi:predicted nucleic acid-binding protein